VVVADHHVEELPGDCQITCRRSGESRKKNYTDRNPSKRDHEPTEEETTWVLEFFRSLKTIVFKDHRQGPFDHIVARQAAGYQAMPENLGLFLHLGHVSSAVPLESTSRR